MEYRVYNTGDQIWVSQRYGKTVSVKIITHDGLTWEEGDGAHRKLTGAERLVHRAVVFCIRNFFKVLA